VTAAVLVGGREGTANTQTQNYKKSEQIKPKYIITDINQIKHNLAS
jgi:hypothetical protein